VLDASGRNEAAVVLAEDRSDQTATLFFVRSMARTVATASSALRGRHLAAAEHLGRPGAPAFPAPAFQRVEGVLSSRIRKYTG